ncbi:energy-coupling factor transporter transmembrane component T family protein [Corynebacterium pygosceleis]|uniref:Energy-coupling factor transporter transmembrane component T n=1 Tax=Corynebacterium pygosceleis TaxID=2800406 RepID=A0A9Q4GK47_9CORY|nr:energy-coupling factor transporter transmembrane component T [Corynebacterium pygosceleis]MCK7638098.1 energy-coupling factor transporter transmembrane protein EcfT [Corynebacterium pygosceleis]MCK7675812.1 energy-coupling factor transporter transmembrane protein EcfT [Corynebacterium pygosceleis]MCL0120806.1 energy-coupling factor transporter transmembrane protein EcfT [Corynebacterium pygosceleis]MCX7444347.1 energy-coupling factor transporter transmembrane component T [Corynebacterium pyg
MSSVPEKMRTLTERERTEAVRAYDRRTPRSRWAHPLLVSAAVPVPMVVTLMARGPELPAVVMAATLIAIWVLNPRWGLAATLSLPVLVVVVGLSFLFWLPDPAVYSPPVDWLPGDPPREKVLQGLTGGLRTTAAGTVAAPLLLMVTWREFTDTVLRYLPVSYRVVDILGLGMRYLRIIGRDLVTVGRMSVLRARGSRVARPRVTVAATVPVLAASMRQGEQLAVAVDGRAFGAYRRRTLHHAIELRPVHWVLPTVIVVAAVAGLLVLG